MRRLLIWMLPFVAFFLMPAHAARVALVIGNAGYDDRPLKNPVNDARDLAEALTGAGFKVTFKQNLSADSMKEAISEFGDALRRENDVGLFFFSGHGVQTAKGNYLLPVGRAFKREKDVELFAVEARSVLSEMQQARNPLNILILDACRDSPLPSAEKSAGSKGLARMDAPSGSVIAFATAPGKTASDNTQGRNGLYTKHLISAINTPGLRLEDVFKRVGVAVENESAQQGGDQSPEEVMKLRSELPFYFKLGNAVQLASLRSEPITPTARPGQATGLSLEDLQKEEETRQAWAKWQAQMKADYDKTAGFTGSADLQAKAWQRFTVAWAQDNPLSREDDEMRSQAASRQQQAQQQSAGQSIKECADCPEMVTIPAGSFTMGSSAAEQAAAVKDGLSQAQVDRESPQHTVRIAYRFALGRYELSRGEFARFVSATAYKTEAEKGDGCFVIKADGSAWEKRGDANWRNPGFAQGDDHPVVCVSWNDAQAYIAWLNKKHPGQGYRLPSEAEWEYAARAGTQTRYPWGDDESKQQICRQANHGEESYSAQYPKDTFVNKNCSDGVVHTAAGKQFPANAFGLHNMHGNALEWVQDYFHDNYTGAPSDGSAWEAGGEQKTRVLRGGSWYGSPAFLRSAFRSRSTPGDRNGYIGFRLARTAP